MPYTVVFLWISAGLSQAPPPPPEQRSRALPAELGQLRDYGAARGLTFEPLASGATTSAGLVAYDAARVDRLEAELEQARTSLSALEEEAAGQRLSRVEAELLAHPHLPQAAFLMAECLALRAQVARQHDPALADELERSRAALEGPRAAAFGDAPASATTASPTIALRVAGLAALDELELDGASSARDVTLAPGLHHLRVWRAGRPIFATFSRVNVAQKQLSLPVPSLRQCGADDLGFVDARAMARGAAAPPGIECERWALARAEGTGIGVALCQRSRCGPFVHWQRRPSEPFTPIAEAQQRLPAWATFAIVGVAAAAATSVVLWQAGAFDSGNPDAASWRYAGLNPQAWRF